MTSFVERESERRTQERSKLLLSGELATKNHKESIYVMDLSRSTCRAVVTTNDFSDRVAITLNLPDREAVQVLAKVTWSKELSPGRWHATFGSFEFASPGQEQQLRSYLNEIALENEEMGVHSLRDLGNDELQRLSRMVKASRALNSSQGYIEALQQVVDVTRRSLGAERGLFLVDRGDEDPVVEVARGGENRGLGFSTTVAKTVSESGKPLLSLDAQTDQALGAVTSIKLLGTVSVMCVPLRTRNRHFGLLYVDNSMSKGIFRDSDLAMATIIADLAAASLEKSYYHHRALQAERVASAKSIVSSLSRDLLPSLRTLEQVSSGMDGSSGDLELLKTKATHCLTLLEQILPLGSSGRRNHTKVDLAEVMEGLRGSFPSGVDLAAPPPDGWPPLSANPEQLSDALSSLISEAIVKGSTVRVLVALEPRMLKLTVCNEALRKSASELKRVFHPRLNSKLSVVQRIVHEHKGLLSAHPDPAGGTVFTVELPLS